jgi:hypothetical protein
LSKEQGTDPASTSEGIQLNETAIRPMEIEWSNRRALSCSAEEYEVAGASGKARKIYVALSFIPGVPLSLSLTPG